MSLSTAGTNERFALALEIRAGAFHLAEEGTALRASN
jgi:hypothetical protein